MKKTYVLDTNVLLSDTRSIFAFEDNNLIIPLVVLEELDRQKSRPDEVGQNAREVNRLLDDFRQQGSLISGITLPNGGNLSIGQLDPANLQKLPIELQQSKVDNQIIAFMLQRNGAILVSKDINVRIKCDCLGILCQDYLNMRVAKSPDAFYRGVAVIDVQSKIIDEVYANGSVPLSSLIECEKLYQNQIVVLKYVDDSIKKSSLTKVVNDKLCQIHEVTDAFGLKPRNKEQKFALDLLFDDRIKLVTLVGPAGTGKTLLALAAGLAQMKFLGSCESQYQKMLVSRPIQTVGNDIGFLPGTLQEKMDPWVSPIRDNLNFLMGSNGLTKKKKAKLNGSSVSDEPYLNILQEQGMIEIEALAYIRGRSIPNSYIVIDEAQNLSIHELKTIITRVGDNTKIVLTGDIEQIDNTHVDIYTNGLSYAVERFKTHAIAGHVSLIKGERSELASLASKIL